MNDKIKDLLAQSYKTDSIAKNKWRIENREKLREQRKKELKELIEKDKTMSNNKQTMKLYTKEQTHTCVFEKSKTSNSNEAKCKHCNNVRYLIHVVKNEKTYNNQQ